MLPIDEQLAHLLPTVETVVPDDGLLELLGEGRPLRVKLGVDPTAPDVTLGWAVMFDLLRRFQELGHTAVLILGDFTAQVGDPSGKSETRKRLSADEVEGYAQSCLAMLRPLLLEDHLEIRRNSEWLGNLGTAGMLELTSTVTVSRILEREDFQGRLADEQPVSMMELLYPLLQGFDSVAIEADIELGGADQLWNLLVGRDVQRAYGQRPQAAVTAPLLVGTDGVRKMSQSLGNYISVADEPEEMFGKVMSIPDAAMPMWYRLAAFASPEEVRRVAAGLAEDAVDPGAAKRQLGRMVVARYRGEDAAAAAEEHFDRLFKHGEAPEDVAEHTLPGDDPIWLPGLLKEAGLVASSSEGKRLVAAGAVRIEGEPVEAEEVVRRRLAGAVVRVGKRRFVRFID